MRARLISVVIAAVLGMILVALPGTVRAAAAGYLVVTGDTQSEIRGGVTQKGHENQIRVLRVSHEVVSPRDAASGLPTGKRQHKPFRLVVELDRSFPQLLNAMVNHENLSEVRLEVYQPSRTGKLQHVYTVRLTNAAVSRAQLVADMIDPAQSRRDELQLEFTYQRIEWTFQDGGITAMDDWETPVASAAPTPRKRPSTAPKPRPKGLPGKRRAPRPR